MFAIVDINGQQMKVTNNQFLYVNRLAAEKGETLSFNKVLLSSDGSNVMLNPGNASVKAEILDHLQGDKVIVFKKKRRKGYKKKNGHRQALTKIRISEISF